MPGFICQRCITPENRGFVSFWLQACYGKSRLALLRNRSGEPAFEWKPTTYGKHVNIHQPRTFQMLRRIKYKYNLVWPKMFLHISFKTPTVDTPFTKFVIIYKWRFWHWVLQILKKSRLVRCSFYVPYPATELETYTLIVYRSILSRVII